MASKNKVASTRDFVPGDQVVVVPSTKTRSTDLEQFVGFVESLLDNNMVAVRKIVGKNSVKTVPLAWLSYHATFEGTPLRGARNRYRTMDDKSKVQLKASASKEVRGYPKGEGGGGGENEEEIVRGLPRRNTGPRGPTFSLLPFSIHLRAIPHTTQVREDLKRLQKELAVAKKENQEERRRHARNLEVVVQQMKRHQVKELRAMEDRLQAKVADMKLEISAAKKDVVRMQRQLDCKQKALQKSAKQIESAKETVVKATVEAHKLRRAKNEANMKKRKLLKTLAKAKERAKINEDTLQMKIARLDAEGKFLVYCFRCTTTVHFQ